MSVISKVLECHSTGCQNTPPINFNTIKHIPESYAWTQSDYSYMSQIDNSCNRQELGLESNNPCIPIIDLEDLDLDILYHACEKWGAFQIINHGVSKEVLEEVEFQTKRLFSLPYDEKLKVSQTPNGMTEGLRAHNSATGYGSPKAIYNLKRMWHEGFTIVGDSMVDHAKVLWPNDYQEFCDVMKDYQKRMKELCEKLLYLIFKIFSIPEFVMSKGKQDPTCDSNDICAGALAMQLNSYPICPDPTQAIGLGQHTDSFLFTIIHQCNDVNGLKVFNEELGWVPINLIPDALTVNLGDLLHIISNARSHSVIHKVNANAEKHRFSIAYFYGPPLDFEVSPFIDYPDSEGPHFKPMKVKEYVSIKGKHRGFALSSIRN